MRDSEQEAIADGGLARSDYTMNANGPTLLDPTVANPNLVSLPSPDQISVDLHDVDEADEDDYEFVDRRNGPQGGRWKKTAKKKESELFVKVGNEWVPMEDQPVQEETVSNSYRRALEETRPKPERLAPPAVVVNALMQVTEEMGMPQEMRDEMIDRMIERIEQLGE